MSNRELPVPTHFDPEKVGDVWRVEYRQLAKTAREWASDHQIQPATKDDFRICLLAIDVQNTFCIPDFELYVAGRSGTGAVDDNQRFCRFLYRNLARISHIVATMDTHQAMQIFHSLFFIDQDGRHPEPLTTITVEDIEEGRWQFNEAFSDELGYDPQYLRRHLLHYTRELKKNEKYDLTIWPYHAILSGIGHALVSSFEEAKFFHTVARQTQPDIQMKGGHPLTEHYSAFKAEVNTDPDGKVLVERNEALFRKIVEFDAVIVGGQAKSHCVSWTVADLLKSIEAEDPSLKQKIYLLEDCSSPVVIPEVVDYTDQADADYQRYREAGVHIVKSSDPIESWPGVIVESLR